MDELSKICLDLARFWNVNFSEITKMVHEYIERSISCDYDRLNCPKPPIYISPVKVKSLKERLEEDTMDADCEFCVKRDICTRDVPTPCRYRYTEEERIADQASDNYGAILAGMYLHKTYEKKTYEKEDNEMNATSVQNIKDVKDIVFSTVAFPIGGPGETLTIRVHTDDDIFVFNFEGRGLVQKCKKSGLFSGWEKEQKIRKLEEEREILLKAKDKVSKENGNLRNEVRVLKDKLINALSIIADKVKKEDTKDE